MSNLKSILESKLGSEITIIGEETLAKLSELALSDEAVDKLSKSLISLQEAENSPSIVEKNKDRWHKETLKGFLDSLDSLTKDHEVVLGENKPTDTKQKTKEILAAYKKEKEALAQEIAELKKQGKESLDAETKALIKEKELELEILKKTHVPADSVETYKTENDSLKRQLEAFKKASLREKVTSAAIKSGILMDINPELAEEIVWSAVKKYTDSETFGLDNSKARIMIDENTKQVVVRNAADPTMGVYHDGSSLTLDSLVKSAIMKFGLNKKSEQTQVEQKIVLNNQSRSTVPTIKEEWFN